MGGRACRPNPLIKTRFTPAAVRSSNQVVQRCKADVFESEYRLASPFLDVLHAPASRIHGFTIGAKSGDEKK
jgi:hypothetical protein